MSETTIDSIRTEIARLEEELRDKKAELRAAKASNGKAKTEPKACGCGCGDLTRGGDFLPGHDARYRGRMLKAIDAGDESAIGALVARPTLLHGATEASLLARLGSEQRKKDAQVARVADREQTKVEARKAKPEKVAKPCVDPVEAQQGRKSPTVTRNAGAIRLAKQRAAA